MNTAYDYVIGEEVDLSSNKPCSLGNIITNNNCVVYYSNPVTIKIDNFNSQLNMTQGDPRDGVYNDTYSSVESLLSVDKKEQLVINRMAKKGYVVVGQLNEDGTYDKFAQAYVNYIGEKSGTITGAIEGLSSRPRNQKLLKNDGTAFVFAELPEIAKQKLEEQKKRLEGQKKLESRRINVLEVVIKDSANKILDNEENIGMTIIRTVNNKPRKNGN